LRYSQFAADQVRGAPSKGIVAPDARVGPILWTSPGSERPFDENQLAERLEADFIAFSLADCVVGALSEDKLRDVEPKGSKASGVRVRLT
jgi:hypothetical protein